MFIILLVVVVIVSVIEVLDDWVSIVIINFIIKNSRIFLILLVEICEILNVWIMFLKVFLRMFILIKNNLKFINVKFIEVNCELGFIRWNNIFMLMSGRVIVWMFSLKFIIVIS